MGQSRTFVLWNARLTVRVESRWGSFSLFLYSLSWRMVQCSPESIALITQARRVHHKEKATRWHAWWTWMQASSASWIPQHVTRIVRHREVRLISGMHQMRWKSWLKTLDKLAIEGTHLHIIQATQQAHNSTLKAKSWKLSLICVTQKSQNYRSDEYICGLTGWGEVGQVGGGERH